MNDSISRQAAIEAILEDKIDDKTLGIVCALGDGLQAQTLNDTCDRHVQIIKALPPTQPKGWVKIPDTGIDDLSDGYHTFRQLYYQRMMLFATIVKQNREKAWKSLRHEDGELCFGGGWFIVGIDTPEGSYTYHYEDNYYSLFDCEELECGKHWDGHTEKDITRLLSLPSAQPDLQEYSVWFRIGETLVDVSKMHITAEEGIEKIRSYLVRMKKPERKKGHWIDEETNYLCSECHRGCWINSDYCPWCGAEMGG